MTVPAPVGFLDFFVLEGSDYVEQLDALLLAGGATGPNAEEMQRVARALRGSATMAKLASFAEIAAGIERVGRGLRDGTLHWGPALKGVVVAAVDDSKVLLRGVRAWGPAEETRARARINELATIVPVRGATPLASPTTQSHDAFLATEASNIGAGLELLATRPADRDAAANVLRRVRALRGLATVKDYAGLSDILEASEEAAQPLELGESTLSRERIALLASASAALRAFASTIRDGGNGSVPAAELAHFATTVDALQVRESGVERIVPIAELFYGDGGETIVRAASNPPTTPSERFRLEAVSQGEHLRRLVADARAAQGELTRERVRRALRQALRGIQLAADSFGEHDIASFVARHNEPAAQFDAEALKKLDQMAAVLAQPSSSLTLATRLSGFHQAAAEPASADFAATVKESATPPSKLGALLDAGISSLGGLHVTPLSTPRAIAEQPPVPIDVLLYRGKAAVKRAVEIKNEAKRGGARLDDDALAELFDLLDLALTD
ncbi:MAG: hypothetical protein V4550_05560 [Gemmatimonadota bacterium]